MDRMLRGALFALLGAAFLISLSAGLVSMSRVAGEAPVGIEAADSGGGV